MKLSTFDKIAKLVDAENILSSSFTDFIPREDADLYDTIDSIEETLRDNGAFDVEIIYCSNAMKYLADEDPSLTEAFEIAEEYGYSLSSLNSETLASLLASRRSEEEWSELRDEVEDIIDENE